VGLALRFGPYAGWAHNTLFISELASLKDRIPKAAGAAAPAAAAIAITTSAAAGALGDESDAEWEPASGDNGSGTNKAAKLPKKKGSKGRINKLAGSAEGLDTGAAAATATAAAAAAASGPGSSKKRRRAGAARSAAGGEGQEGLAGWRQRKARGD
jgi:hypothetical protein